MCGFAGIINNTSSSFDENKVIIKRMTESIHHRGPDSDGYWNDIKNNIYFGHKRLSIVDLSIHGSQPMISADKNFCIIFNGEIYNHQLIRDTLKLDINRKFKGSSDTETLIEAISKLGIEETLNNVSGMFAFALYDKKNDFLYLGRDIVGEKPLYYSKIFHNGTHSLVFGSEIKIFKYFPFFKKNINLESVNYQQLYKYIPSPLTIYENVFKVNPGTYLKFNIKDLSFEEKKFWDVDDVINSSKSNLFNIDESENLKILENSINDSVKSQLLGDVEIGTFLSGGIDSSLITALAQKNLSNTIKTFTVGFSNKEFNEAENAKKIANYLKTDHHEIYLSSSDLINAIPSITEAYDEPFSDSSQIPTYLISKFASEKVKVCLSGDGGDELFAGYNRYAVTQKFWKFLSSCPLFIRKLISKFLLNISPYKWNYFIQKFEFLLSSNNKYIHYGDKIHKGAECLTAENILDLYYVLISDLKFNYNDCVLNYHTNHMSISQYKFENINSVEYFMRNDFINYLPNDILTKVDRAAMKNSLETRMPFLNKNLISNIWKTPHSLKIKNNQSKYILKKILNNYLPNSLIENKKKGFSIPLADWLRGDLKSWAGDYTSKSSIEKHGIFDYKKVSKLWDNHISMKQNNHSQLWSILTMQSWLDNNL